MVSVDKLYDLYNVISGEKGKESEHQKEYEEILGGVKGDVAARKITAQFISRYFATFPNLEEKSLDALFDLCEDDDSAIRKQSITSLGVVCRGKPSLVPKVADILAQLLQVDESAEINCVNSSLVALLRIHSKGALTGLFYQLENNQSEVIRERVLRFLMAKVQALSNDVFTKDIQVFIFQEAKKMIHKATAKDLPLLVEFLQQIPVCRTITAQQQLHDQLMTQLDLEKAIEIKPEPIVLAVTILNQAKNFYNNQVKSTKTVEYICKQVLPHLEAIEAALLLTGKPEHAAMVLTLLQLTAQSLQYVDALEDAKAAMEHVFKALLAVLPVPPADGAPGWEAEGGCNLQFSRVECLLFSLQRLTKHTKEDFFTDADALKDLRQRLTYFARGSQAYQKVLRDSIADKKGDELKTEESKTKLIALKTTANITTIVKDFFHNPPSAKSTITLSWIVDATPAPVAQKRKAEIMDESPAKGTKASRKIYAPPGGKFSRGAGSFRGGRGRGRGNRGRGGFRKY